MRKPFGTTSRRLLARQQVMGAGDLRMILRPGFWPEAERDKDIPAAAAAAAVVLLLLGGVPLFNLDGIEAADTLPDDAPDRVGVPVSGQVISARLPPTAARVVSIWKRIRPTFGSTRLFVTSDGAPMSYGTLRGHLTDAFAALGLEGTPTKHGKLFLIDRFRRHPAFDEKEAGVLKRWLARLDGHARCPAPTREEERLVFERCDPFPDLGALDFRDAAAIAHARELGTELPDTYLECLRPAVDPSSRGLPPDHPLLADIAAATVEGRLTKAKRIEIYLKHREELSRRATDESLLHREAAELFGLGYCRYWELAREAESSIGQERPRGKHYARKKKPLPVPTEEETARIKRIGAIAWPMKKSRDGYRRGVLHKHGDFVRKLVRERKIGAREAAELLGLNLSSFTRFRLDAEAGVAKHWYAPAPSRAETDMWRTMVFERRNERRKGQSKSDFIRELRKRFDLPISQTCAAEALVSPPKRRGGSSRPKITLPLSKEDARHLRSIRASRWPANSHVREAHRLSLLRRHGESAFALVTQRLITTADVVKLFRLTLDRALDLVVLQREGDFAMALKKRTRAEARAGGELFVSEFVRRGAEAGVAELCRDIRRRLKVYVPTGQARNLVWRMNRAEGAARIEPTGPRVVRGRVRSMPTAEERKRLKTMAATDWQVADVAELRRRILTAHGDFVMVMTDGHKIDRAEAARLVGVPTVAFSGLRADWKLGFSARHLLPPAQGRDRDAQLAIVRAEVRCGERPESLIRRLGGMGVLLPRHVIEKLRNRIIADRSAD